MSLSKKTAADFNITKGTPLVGSLKPNKVSERKTYDSAIGITPAGTSSTDAMLAKVPINNSK
tara:strand:+ start:608 stop:793 length:186 start_codon:yes stop_codon:yes gene_type:complete